MLSQSKGLPELFSLHVICPAKLVQCVCNSGSITAFG